jgi:hypothetical protein
MEHIKTPQVDAKIRLTRKNEFDILDHYVSSAPGVEVFVPMRVVPNYRYGSERSCLPFLHKASPWGVTPFMSFAIGVL